MKKEGKFKQWLNIKFTPWVSKLGSQIHLSCIRDAFGTLIPLIIAGSFGLIMSGIIFGGSGSGYVSLLGLIARAANPSLSWDGISELLAGSDNAFGRISAIGSTLFSQVVNITIGMNALWFAFTFGYFLALGRNSKNAVLAGFVSLISFLATTMGEITFFQGPEGIITALIFGIISTEMFLWLSNVRALYIKLPDGVPPSVSKSFALLLPFVITVLTVAASNMVFVIPNVLGAGLTVTSSNFIALSGAELEDFLSQFHGVDIVEINEMLAGIFGDEHIDLIERLTIILSDSSLPANAAITQIQTLYDTLSGQDQIILSSMLAILNGVDPSQINNLFANASMQIVSAAGIDIILIQYVANQVTGAQFGWSAAIYQFFVSSLLVFATGDGGLGLAIVYMFLVHLLWFFGIHGLNVVNSVFGPIWQTIGVVNILLITQLGYSAAAATGEMGVFANQFFDSFVNLGGSGATFMLLIGTMVFSKRQELKKIAVYATPSGIFQINEPVIFGYPIVLNPIYAIPFVMAPISSVIIAWVFSPAVLGVYGYAQLVIPWTTPYLIAAPLAYLDLWAIVPALAVTIATFFIYLPFILIDNKLYFKKLKRENIEQYNLEMRFYFDPRFKYQTLTTNKYERLVSQAENILADAESQNNFWEQKMTNEEKLKIRKEKNNQIADLRMKLALLKAMNFKEIREASEVLFNKKWDMQLAIKEINKQYKAIFKTIKKEKNNEIVLKTKEERKQKVLNIKEEYSLSKNTRLEQIKMYKENINTLKEELIKKYKINENEVNQQIKEIKNKK